MGRFYEYGGTEKDVPRPATWAKPGPKPRPRTPFDPAKCGTEAGYQQHARHGLPKDEACRQAHNAYMSDYKSNRRAA